MIKLKFSEYTLTARLYPAIISIIPVVIFNYFYLNSELSNFFNFVTAINWIPGVSVSLLFIFLFSQINRYIAKEFFEKRYFNNGLDMPTTNFLMPTNRDYSSEMKDRIYNKIAKDFKIIIKKKNLKGNSGRKIIVEIVALIRKKVSKETLLLQHNTEYGFIRNLIGGSTIALTLSLVNLYFFSYISYNSLALKISIVTVIAYLIPIILSKKLMTDHGYWYAKVLFQEYLSIR